MMLTLARSLAVILLSAVAFCAWIAWFALTPVPLAASPVDFSIRPGSALRSATRQIIDAGVIMPEWKFKLLARLALAGTRIQAGGYEVAAGVTPWDILRKITQGDFSQSEILFVEGWTFRQMRAALKANPDLQHRTDALSDADIMARLGAPATPPEGMFFPDTYLFGKGESDLAILARAYRGMQKQLQSAWQQRAADLPVANPYEALILASLVEKETGKATDRGMVAGVFVSRLRLGMKLQTDPAVIYGMRGNFDGNLRKRDLEADSPFNTYMRRGLPPHPIAMPGLPSIVAVMNPAKTDALYFVARGDGTSEFSRTLDDHNRAVARYQKPGAAKQRKGNGA